MGDEPIWLLVVDDDEDMLALIRWMLESKGYRVDTATNGSEALDVVAAHLPDLILLDLKMPVMDGPAFAAQLRELHEAAPPIVVITAADDARKRAMAIHAAGWLAKPFEPSDLLREVAQGLNRSVDRNP
jgi:CheY-like chemotaxis protein